MANANSAQADARAAVGEALREHAGALRGFVARRVPSDQVEDVLQAAAARAIERSRTLRDPQRVVAWLYRLHRHAIADAGRRRSQTERLVAANGEVPEVAVEPSEMPCGCSLVLARGLNPAYAEMLALVDAGEKSVAEAADILEISANNAAVRLHRARQALRKAMREHCGVQTAKDCSACRCTYDGCCAA